MQSTVLGASGGDRKYLEYSFHTGEKLTAWLGRHDIQYGAYNLTHSTVNCQTLTSCHYCAGNWEAKVTLIGSLSWRLTVNTYDDEDFGIVIYVIL